MSEKQELPSSIIGTMCPLPLPSPRPMSLIIVSFRSFLYHNCTHCHLWGNNTDGEFYLSITVITIKCYHIHCFSKNVHSSLLIAWVLTTSLISYIFIGFVIRWYCHNFTPTLCSNYYTTTTLRKNFKHAQDKFVDSFKIGWYYCQNNIIS